MKKGFLEISQNSQENTCARVFFNKVAGLNTSGRLLLFCKIKVAITWTSFFVILQYQKFCKTFHCKLGVFPEKVKVCIPNKGFFKKSKQSMFFIYNLIKYLTGKQIKTFWINQRQTLSDQNLLTVHFLQTSKQLVTKTLL